MIGIGILGIGFMGVTHYKAIEKVKGAKVAAICTRDATKLKGDWRQVQGNFGISANQGYPDASQKAIRGPLFAQGGGRTTRTIDQGGDLTRDGGPGMGACTFRHQG